MPQRFITMRRFIIPEKILDEIEIESKKVAKIANFSYEKLSEQLINYLDGKLETRDKRLYKKYKWKDQSHIGLDKRSIARAWKQNGDDGATEELCRLLCYFGFDKKLEDVLKDKKYGGYNSLEEFKNETRKIREANQKTKTNCNSSNKINENTGENKTDELENETTLDSSTENYTILVLPFRNPEKYKGISPLGENLVDRYNEKNERENLGLRLKYLPDILPKDAEEIGKKMNADLVIWGNDSKPDGAKSHLICFHYLHIPSGIISENPPVRGKTEKYEIDRLFEITEGNLQLEIDDVIYWFLGSKFYFKQDFKSALTNFRKIAIGKYKNEDLFLNMANCYYFLRSFNQAKLHYEKAIEINPNCKQSVYSNYAALLFTEFDDVKGAKKYFETSLKIDPQSAGTHSSYATLLMNKMNDLIGAEVHFKKALELNPQFAEVHFSYAILLDTRINNINKAIVHYKKAIEINPNYTEAFYRFGILHKNKLNDFDGAIELFKKALEIYPNYVNVLNSYWSTT